jgi:hypothetical protein
MDAGLSRILARGDKNSHEVRIAAMYGRPLRDVPVQTGPTIWPRATLLFLGRCQKNALSFLTSPTS